MAADPPPKTHLLQSHTASVSEVAVLSCSVQPGCSSANVHNRRYLHTVDRQWLCCQHNIPASWQDPGTADRTKEHPDQHSNSAITSQPGACVNWRGPALDCICLHGQELRGRGKCLHKWNAQGQQRDMCAGQG